MSCDSCTCAEFFKSLVTVGGHSVRCETQLTRRRWRCSKEAPWREPNPQFAPTQPQQDTLQTHSLYVLNLFQQHDYKDGVGASTNGTFMLLIVLHSTGVLGSQIIIYDLPLFL